MLGLIKLQKIIDFHAHVFPEKIAEKAVRSLCGFYDFEVPSKNLGTPDDVLKKAKEGGVDYILCHSTATSPEQVQAINSWIAGELKDGVLGFGTMHQDYKDFEKELIRIRTLGLRGIKMHPDFQCFYIDDEKLFGIYRVCEDMDLPILFHAGDVRYGFSAPKRIYNVMNRFPRLRIIAAHLGGYSEWDSAAEHLSGGNVWYDTSSTLWFIPPEKATGIIKNHGIKKVFFGTDYPIRNHAEELEQFNKLGLTAEEKSLILFENANEFLGLGL